jgi:hypothetical protein
MHDALVLILGHALGVADSLDLLTKVLKGAAEGDVIAYVMELYVLLGP